VPQIDSDTELFPSDPGRSTKQHPSKQHKQQTTKKTQPHTTINKHHQKPMNFLHIYTPLCFSMRHQAKGEQNAANL
jgi:hypothetical protein